MIALHFVQRLLRSVGDELWGVVSARHHEYRTPFSDRMEAAYSQEPLSHIYDRLDGRRLRCFVDDGPALNQMYAQVVEAQGPYQTSCFCPATRFAGLKGSLLAVVEDIAGRGLGDFRKEIEDVLVLVTG